MSETPVYCSIAVEGDVDGKVAERLLEHVGARTAALYVTRGKDRLQAKLPGYNQAARFSPWLVLVDLNQKLDCAPLLRAAWLPSPAPHLCFRVAVRTLEAWLMADAQRLADFLGVPAGAVPRKPESELRPKETMVNLARRSRRREIREDMVPREGSGRPVGNAYSSRLVEFASGRWRPVVAARRSDSLRRCIRCVERLANPA